MAGNRPLLGDERPAPPPYVQSRIGPSSGGPPAGGGSPAVGGPGADTPAPPAVTPVAFPPHYFPPPADSTPIYPFSGNVNVGPGPVDWTIPAAVVTNIQASQMCVVRGTGLAVRNLLSSTLVSMVLRVNAAPTAPTRQIPAAPLAYAEQQWDDVSYVIPGPATIDLLVTIGDGGTYTVTGYYWGWILTASAWAKYYGK